MKNQLAGFFTAFRKSWALLSKVDVLDWRFYAWYPAIHLMTGVAYEEIRLGVQFQELLPALLIAELIFLVCFFGGHRLLKRLNKNAFGATGKLLILIGGAQLIRGLVFEIAIKDFYGITEAIDLRRLPGDFTLGVLVGLVFAYLQTAQAEFLEDSEELERIRLELEQQREEARSAAAKAESALRDRAHSALLGKLAEVKKLLAKTDAAHSAEQVRRLLEQEVRPLSKEIWQQFEVISEAPKVNKSGRSGIAWPGRMPLKRAFRPALIFLFANLNLIATANALAGPEFAMTLLLFSVTMLPLGGLIRWAIKDDYEPDFWLGFLTSLALTGVSLLPTWIYLFSVADVYPNAVGLRQSGAGLIVLVVTGLAIRAAYATSRERLLQRLDDLNQQLSKEISLIEQAVWIAKRNWSFIVHGTVQGALTVAHSRLKQDGASRANTVKLVKGDIENARTALLQGAVKRQNLDHEFADVISTWDGVCKITIDYLETELNRVDENAQICTVELMKEITGNAFRHGRATEINFEITLESGRVLLNALNNGAPVTADTAGLGTELLNELAEKWSIENAPGGVLVRAAIPFRGDEANQSNS